MGTELEGRMKFPLHNNPVDCVVGLLKQTVCNYSLLYKLTKIGKEADCADCSMKELTDHKQKNIKREDTNKMKASLRFHNYVAHIS